MYREKSRTEEKRTDPSREVKEDASKRYKCANKIEMPSSSV